MKRNAFGQLICHPYLRFFNDDGDGGGGAGGGGGGEYTPPATQADLDKIVTERANRAAKAAEEKTAARFADYEAQKADAEKFRAAQAAEAAKNAGKDDAPKPVSEDDVDKRISDALAAKDLELAMERVSDRLDEALKGRTFPASLLLNLDRKQFVKDGKAVDTDALKEWVEKNSTQVDTVDSKRRQIPGQGDRDANAAGGSVQAGRDLYEKEHPTKSSRKD